MALRLVVKRLADNVMQPTSYNRLTNLVKGIGVKTTVSSVIDYVRFAKEACVLFSLENYASQFVEKETVKKHYFTDNGLLNIFLTQGEAALLENVCAIHLYKKYAEGVYFYNKNVEVDFYVPTESYAVQASYTVADEATLRREIEAFKRLHAFRPLERMVIVTYDEEQVIPLGEGRAVEVIPGWKWLLESE